MSRPRLRRPDDEPAQRRRREPRSPAATSDEPSKSRSDVRGARLVTVQRHAWVMAVSFSSVGSMGVWGPLVCRDDDAARRSRGHVCFGVRRAPRSNADTPPLSSIRQNRGPRPFMRSDHDATPRSSGIAKFSAWVCRASRSSRDTSTIKLLSPKPVGPGRASVGESALGRPRGNVVWPKRRYGGSPPSSFTARRALSTRAVAGALVGGCLGRGVQSAAKRPVTSEAAA